MEIVGLRAAGSMKKGGLIGTFSTSQPMVLLSAPQGLSHYGLRVCDF